MTHTHPQAQCSVFSLHLDKSSIFISTLAAAAAKKNRNSSCRHCFHPFSLCLGVTIGLSSSPAAVYSAEIATPELRGRMTVLTSMAIAVGILMIYTLGFIFPVRLQLLRASLCVRKF
jgi:MFS family permease